MKYSEIKELRAELSDYGFYNWRKAIEMVANCGEVDFTINDFRFIDAGEIDKIQKDTLASDPYVLGSFSDWFIANNTDLSLNKVQKLQKAEKFDIIGNYIIDHGFLAKIQEDYVNRENYGHYFNPYDGSERIVNICGNKFYVFRT